MTWVSWKRESGLRGWSCRNYGVRDLLVRDSMFTPCGPAATQRESYAPVALLHGSTSYSNRPSLAMRVTYVWYVRMCIYIYIYVYTHIHICMCMCIYIYICVYIYTYTHIQLHVCMCINIHTHIYTYIYTCIYTYTLSVDSNYSNRLAASLQKPHCCLAAGTARLIRALYRCVSPWL